VESLSCPRAERDLEVKAYIEAMDFGLLLDKITRFDVNTGIVWPRAAAEQAIRQYKNYLFLVYKHRRQHDHLPPSIEIDEIWHHHILHTERYHKDCEYIFGMYLHHFPYFGMRGEQDFKNLQSAYEVTKSLYEAEFGEPLLELIEFANRNE
jgi:hypothetical protein